MTLILTILFIFAILLINEIWWRKQRVHNEISRKFVHVTVGTFVAFWPFFLTWQEIRILSIAFIVCVLVSKQLKIFQAIHSVQRPTYGEVLFAAAVGAIALITQNEWIYMAAVLQMSLRRISSSLRVPTNGTIISGITASPSVLETSIAASIMARACIS